MIPMGPITFIWETDFSIFEASSLVTFFFESVYLRELKFVPGFALCESAPTLLDGSVYETEDLLSTITGFGTPVTRTYTLAVSTAAFGGTQKDSRSHITGWDFDNDDWIYNEEKFAQFDRVLDMASKHGVKLIIPIINQDYGTRDTDFVGNFNDLIRHRYNITSYRVANTEVDWFTDVEMRCAFKKIIRKLLTRRNTFNGKIYGEDDTIFAWETGNEMNWGRQNNTIHDQPAPAEVLPFSKVINGTKLMVLL
ncbi:family 5 glycoside hydrolase [Melampsora larici-populina 98AG31]|uniref:mannan endo-1,4-beta-mannosidase n=1 Tax=Melampsora larici-populina (strain 98AG31 / pathotype 3-4-7) TaxID=747676 RepID=F4SD46_MELLP|nr:family 5 glycoside hydrolase [Melampsora larici-populina 98AG31]EGF97419.1 family 5 glycoside hydrolase [Melampsora larici-populina 98AG31]